LAACASGHIGSVLRFQLINNANTSTTAQQTNIITYTDFYNQINAKNIKTATFIGETEVKGDFNTPFRNQTQYTVRATSSRERHETATIAA